MKTLFNSKKSLIVLLGTLLYVSYNPLASASWGRFLETLQHIAFRRQSSPQISQTQVCLRTTGLVLFYCQAEALSDRELRSFEPWNRKFVISRSTLLPW